MPSGVVSPVRNRPSSKPGNTQSARTAKWLTQWRICSGEDQSVGRRLGSNEMVLQAARGERGKHAGGVQVAYLTQPGWIDVGWPHVAGRRPGAVVLDGRVAAV